MMSLTGTQPLQQQQHQNSFHGGGGGGETFGNQQQANSSNNNNNNNHNGKVITSMHLDYIYHVAFDVYGRRMATCSGDRFVRVWDLTDSGDWNLVGQWQAHRGNVTKVSWAHPEFGSVLATSGSDSDAKIWEERTHAVMSNMVGVTTSTSTINNNNNGGGTPLASVTGGLAGNNAASSSSLASRWTIKTQLTEARKAVSCLEFAPRHWGLKLATGSADGCVRIYEAVDIMNLAQWPLAATLQAFGEGTSTNAGQSLGVLCLSWCTGRFEPPTLVVGGSHLALYRYIEQSRTWQPLLQLPSSGANSNVLDVAWAPNVGRRFHYIASAEDQHLRIYKLSRTYTNSDDNGNKGKNRSGGSNNKSSGINNNKLEVESSQALVANAWRCQWNVTGTVLASSGDAGTVQMWKADNDGNFRCVAQVQGDLSQAA